MARTAQIGNKIMHDVYGGGIFCSATCTRVTHYLTEDIFYADRYAGHKVRVLKSIIGFMRVKKHLEDRISYREVDLLKGFMVESQRVRKIRLCAESIINSLQSVLM